MNGADMNETNAAPFEAQHAAEIRMPMLESPLFVVDGEEVLARNTAHTLTHELEVNAIPFPKMDAALAAFMLNPDACAGLVTNIFMEPCADCGCLSGVDLAKRFVAFGKPVLFLTGLDGARERTLLGSIGYYLNKAQFQYIVSATASGERTVLRHFLNAAAVSVAPEAPQEQIVLE
jgi:hypothetical protein